MMSDDDDVEPQLSVVKNYDLLDDNKQLVCFSTLPLRLGDAGDDAAPQCKNRLVLWGTVDGITVYREVLAWRLDLEGNQPEVAVLAADGAWINLVKPKSKYEETARTILITVRMLHFLRRKPDEPEKNLWSHLRKVFDKFDVRPSEDDFRNHRLVIKQFAEKDPVLAKSEILRGFIEGRSRKNITEVGADNIMVKQPFIADDEDIDEMVSDDNNNDSEEEEDEDLFDSICAICDNGGDLLCCDGPCMRSFHAKEGTGEDSYCATLGYTEAEVQAMKIFLCKNCEYKQHQCYICGALEPSDGAGAKVFLCNNATCGHFYHPKCVAQQLHPSNRKEASELEKLIAGGFSFTCPIHWCFDCKGLEDRTQEPLQFAVCRRCPKSYHRKCLPREISFKDVEEEGIITRAWELSKRILIYCLDHDIDIDIDTPPRDHIKFPRILKPAGFVKHKAKLPVNKKRTYSESVLDEPSKEPSKMTHNVRAQESLRTKQTTRNVPVKTSSQNLVDKPEKKKARILNMKTQRDPHMCKDASIRSPVHVEEQEQEMVPLPSPATRKIPLSSFPVVDSEIEKRVIDLLGKEVSSLTLKDVSRKCSVPSTHVYSGRQTERIIAQGKLERFVQAVEAALKKLEKEGNVDAAKAVCEPDVLRQLAKWHSKLRVYISPFIHGTRYSSFGRHFTKVEKLVEIVDKVHWYVEPGDMIVDFCCGANDFSRLMKEKLDQAQKKCNFKNYDLIQPQNRFCFEKRDWMTVQPEELCDGSQLIMGLNPPFGVKASLANKFIDKALSFKPKLIVLIVPKETKRLDKKKAPYDLIWEDSECLAGKAFYLPGSVDHNDKTVEGWNASAPPLYLWSRPDLTKKHMKVAEEHNHTCIGNIACHVDERNDLHVKERAESSEKLKAISGKEKENTGKMCFPKEDNLSDDLPVRKQADVANKWNSGSSKERVTGDKTTGDVRDSNLRADRLAKKRARSEEEKETLGKTAVLMKDDDTSNNLPTKKLTEGTYKEVPRSGKEKENGRYESRGADNILPPEKQVEVAYEETKVTRSRKRICEKQRGALREYERNAHREGGDSDMSTSPPDSRNVRNKSRSYSPSVPADRRVHPDNYMSCPAKEPYDSSFHRPPYKGGYLESNGEYSDALKRRGPTFPTDIDDRSRKGSSSFEEITNLYAAAPPVVDPYSLQCRGDDGNFYRQQISDVWNPIAYERNLDADMHMQGHLRRYGGQDGDSRFPLTTDSQTHPRIHGGTGADDYLQARYPLGYSGDRFSQPASTIPSFGLSGASAPRGSVMDRYTYGLLGTGGPQSSVMDKYALSLDGTSNTKPKNFLPQQYSFGRPGSSGGGRPL